MGSDLENSLQDKIENFKNILKEDDVGSLQKFKDERGWANFEPLILEWATETCGAALAGFILENIAPEKRREAIKSSLKNVLYDSKFDVLMVLLRDYVFFFEENKKDLGFIRSAISNRSPKCVEVLSHSVDTYDSMSDMLWDAVRENSLECVKVLISCTDVDLVKKRMLLNGGKQEFLLLHSIHAELKDRTPSSFLVDAILAEDLERAKQLIKNGARLSFQDQLPVLAGFVFGKSKFVGTLIKETQSSKDLVYYAVNYAAYFDQTDFVKNFCEKIDWTNQRVKVQIIRSALFGKASNETLFVLLPYCHPEGVISCLEQIASKGMDVESETKRFSALLEVFRLKENASDFSILRTRAGL